MHRNRGQGPLAPPISKVWGGGLCFSPNIWVIVQDRPRHRLRIDHLLFEAPNKQKMRVKPLLKLYSSSKGTISIRSYLEKFKNMYTVPQNISL